MLHINKIKTMYGLKYAVVDTSFTYDNKGNKVFYTHPVEYQGANYKKDNRDIRVAVFPLTKEGLAKAKEVQALFKK